MNQHDIYIIMVIVSANFLSLLVVMGLIFLGFRILKKNNTFVKDTLLQKHASTEDSMLVCTDVILQQIKFLNKWQKYTAQLIRDERTTLHDHVAMTNELREIAKKLSEQLLKDR